MRPALFLALTLLAAPALAETRYLAGADDVPLPQGFAEQAGAAVTFAGDGGRLLETRARGAEGAETVRAFYAEALPPLGWSQAPAAQDEPLAFRRGRERLTIEFAPAQHGLDLTFRLVASPAQFDHD